jgi:four helix bundle protein
MNNTSISIQERSKKFAIRIINAYTEINKKSHFTDAVAIVSKQFLRSGTSIGANCAEAKSAQSTADFISKYSIALKEAQETKYWIEIMIESNSVPAEKFVILIDEINSIINILATSIKSLKNKNS